MLYRRLIKPTLDFIGAFLLLLVLSPLLCLIALLIRLESSGPALFIQERVGAWGRPFSCIKFRTMVTDADKQGSGVLCLQDDPRVTRVGRLLRIFSLDELPQLINVLRGEMSLIGPRPGLKFQAELYTPIQRRRLEVKPGITGWAQVNGRNSISWDRRIELDVDYVENLSLGLDLKILLLTLKTVAGRENLYAEKDYFQEKKGRAA